VETTLKEDKKIRTAAKADIRFGRNVFIVAAYLEIRPTEIVLLGLIEYTNNDCV